MAKAYECDKCGEFALEPALLHVEVTRGEFDLDASGLEVSACASTEFDLCPICWAKLLQVAANKAKAEMDA
jgi:hypothetical protein